jgi:hypothetical protein
MIYTVTTQRFKIRFIDPETHEVSTYAEEVPFNDPSEACGEFQAYAGKRGAEYVTPATFAKKIAALKKLHARRAEWTAATQPQEEPAC